MLWHVRLDHISRSYFEKAAKIIPELKNVKFEKDIADCEIRERSKMARKPCRPTTVRHRFNEPLRLIHTCDVR